jgi:recombination protein RecR
MVNLIKELGRLPGIGEKSAERLAYHVLRSSKDDALRLSQAIRDVKEKVRQCSTCCNMAETDPCSICGDAGRDHSVVCVVEEPKDLLAMERGGTFRGVYHVLGGRIAPLEGMDPGNLNLAQLAARVKSGEVREVVLALNPNMEGDLTAHHVAELMKAAGIRVTQIARGIPPGSQIEYASQAILSDAMKGRREIE